MGLEKAFAVRTLHPESSADPTPGELARLRQNQQGGKRGPFIASACFTCFPCLLSSQAHQPLTSLNFTLDLIKNTKVIP